MDDCDDIVKEFLVESHENLDRLDREVVELEKKPSDREILAGIFRTIHTIKGTSGFLSFSKLEAVTHVGESLLARLRDGQLSLNPERTTALLALVDAVRQMLAAIRETGRDGDADHSELVASLTRLQQVSPPAVPEGDGSGAKPAQSEPGAAPLPEAVPRPPEAENKKKKKKKAEAPAGARQECEAKLEAKAKAHELPEPALSEREKDESKTEVVTAAESGAEERVHEDAPAGPVPAEHPTGASEAQAAESHPHEATRETIRVDVGLLDKLMNLVGELVLARNQILQFTRTTEETNLVTTGQRLNLIATELQESVMKTRMQAIGSVWSRFPRTVRDVALSCGKQVRIEMEGQETELDKTLLEAIKDPMTHLVRNAVDHGIERAEERQAAGKGPEGLLKLRAYHEGGQVNIEISDDGAGLDLKKVVAKALQKGLIGADQAARLTDREAANLIFLPGLSTAEKVTNVSGRGVGMDVVKTNIERIGGAVDLQSAAGKGTTVKVKIPLTLAIVPALIVTRARQRYAIPQVSLLELVGLEGEEACKRVETIHGAPVYRLRGSLLPLVHLKDVLGQADGGPAQEGGGNTRTLLDFTQARLKHTLWMDRLRKVLDGHSTITLEEAGSHEDCALGTWLYGHALKEYAALKEMKLLEDKHKHIHELVREVVSHSLAGDAGKAEDGLARVDAASKEVVGLLNAQERCAIERNRINIVVLQADGQKFGLVVDEVSDTEEIVVKPLGRHLKNVSLFAGATIMGDGKVALILDVLGLAQHARVVGESRDRTAGAAGARPALESRPGSERQPVLLFRLGDTGRMAIELSAVARLEEFPAEALEIAGERETVQYRGQIMPLVRLSEVLPGRQRSGDEVAGPLQVVVVYGGSGRNIGLIVDSILDVVDESYALDRHTARHGVMGSAVIQQRITDVVDVAGLVAPYEGAALPRGCAN
jgi:chemotaxis protein histidine kinase CheA